MVSLMTAFGDKTLADLDSFVYTYWFSAVKHAAMISNLMSITVKGKAEVSPYTHITGKIFPMSQLYPFFARASAIVQSKHDNNFERRRISSRIKKPTERASKSTSNDRQNKASKALPYINREKVRYLYTDLSSSIIQPVVLNEDAWEINKHALTYFQNADHMKNIVVKTEVDIDARSFINLNPTNQPTLEQIKNYSSYKALLYPEGERRTTDMEDLEVFLGFEVPRAQRRDEQHSGQAPGAEALITPKTSRKNPRLALKYTTAQAFRTMNSTSSSNITTSILLYPTWRKIRIRPKNTQLTQSTANQTTSIHTK